jgi:hypothetical protein
MPVIALIRGDRAKHANVAQGALAAKFTDLIEAAAYNAWEGVRGVFGQAL